MLVGLVWGLEAGLFLAVGPAGAALVAVGGCAPTSHMVGRCCSVSSPCCVACGAFQGHTSRAHVGVHHGRQEEGVGVGSCEGDARSTGSADCQGCLARWCWVR
jgi:hypothetical protein